MYHLVNGVSVPYNQEFIAERSSSPYANVMEVRAKLRFKVGVGGGENRPRQLMLSRFAHLEPALRTSETSLRAWDRLGAGNNLNKKSSVWFSQWL